MRAAGFTTPVRQGMTVGDDGVARYAGVMAAPGRDAPYAPENIGMTDAGTDKAPWLNLSVRAERGAEHPLLELRRQYDRWRRTQPR